MPHSIGISPTYAVDWGFSFTPSHAVSCPMSQAPKYEVNWGFSFTPSHALSHPMSASSCIAKGVPEFYMASGLTPT